MREVAYQPIKYEARQKLLFHRYLPPDTVDNDKAQGTSDIQEKAPNTAEDEQHAFRTTKNTKITSNNKE